jgi:hypothetical protein
MSATPTRSPWAAALLEYKMFLRWRVGPPKLMAYLVAQESPWRRYDSLSAFIIEPAPIYRDECYWKSPPPGIVQLSPIMCHDEIEELDPPPTIPLIRRHGKLPAPPSYLMLDHAPWYQTIW